MWMYHGNIFFTELYKVETYRSVCPASILKYYNTTQNILSFRIRVGGGVREKC